MWLCTSPHSLVNSEQYGQHHLLPDGFSVLEGGHKLGGFDEALSLFLGAAAEVFHGLDFAGGAVGLDHEADHDVAGDLLFFGLRRVLHLLEEVLVQGVVAPGIFGVAVGDHDEVASRAVLDGLLGSQCGHAGHEAKGEEEFFHADRDHRWKLRITSKCGAKKCVAEDIIAKSTKRLPFRFLGVLGLLCEDQLEDINGWKIIPSIQAVGGHIR
jgi:hypothetical protein